MAKTFAVELGFKEREFKYTRKDREEFEEITGRGMWTAIKEDVLALNAKDEPTPGGKLKIQRLLVWIGLRHGGHKVTQEAVSTWLDEVAEKNGSELAIYYTAANAVLASGVLGIKHVFEDEEEDDPKETPEPAPTA